MNEWVKWVNERILKERQTSGVRWSPIGATDLDGQVYVRKILESIWEILYLSLGVTIFKCNILIKKKITHLTPASFLSPPFLSTALLGEKLFKIAVYNFLHFCCSVNPLQRGFVSYTQENLVLSMPLIDCLFQTQWPMHILGALTLFFLPFFLSGNTFFFGLSIFLLPCCSSLLLDLPPLPKHQILRDPSAPSSTLLCVFYPMPQMLHKTSIPSWVTIWCV